MSLHIVQILPMYHPDGEKKLRELADVKQFNEFDEQEIIKYLQQNSVDGIILRAPAKITPAILNHCENVIAISGAGIGLDNIDVEYATAKGIKVLHAPKMNSTATAEHAVALLLSVMKDISVFHTEMQKGNFSFRDGRYTTELEGKTLGMIGFGSIAQKVAKIVKNGFEMNVTAYVRTISDDRQQLANSLGVELTTSMEDVFRKSDAISLHIPLTNQTKELIDQKVFNVMKPSAVLINTSRGGIIHEEDLVEALKNRTFLRAAVDVFAVEPPAENHPFYGMNEITMTPHIGGISIEAAKMTSVAIAENLIKAISGEELSVIANAEKLLS
ncbi:NAD(P)-dependent oxidoreductase [Sporosarcina gallistercoris]|uniref:Hydroxyacid dehydrogenase n=1 Tax=Sporosarcina gallistercoris TaxID=2762245 RepID=A0ABR8PJU6_9BACL|nr:NAD(P)-dependent oxidoreductase [Sporosarcina gallistercoris]MBD7908443.1 hydroxyacid dehydrogenase [Sporosarcina gallistercoris]